MGDWTPPCVCCWRGKRDTEWSVWESTTDNARNRDRIVSKKELLTEVWHYADADIETRTVDIHMLKFRKKISSLTEGAPFILTVRGEGYRLEP